VFEYDVAVAARVVIRVKVDPLTDRSIRKPVSFDDLSSQARFIWVAETETAASD